MKSLFSRFAAFVFLMAMFSACSAPNTPQERAAAFWEAVSDNDAGDAVRYSTLENEEAYDAFGEEWRGLKPSWGRIVIEGDAATVTAEFGVPGRPEAESRRVITYLVRRDGQWKVDYSRTATGLQGGAFGVLLGELGKLGKALSEHLAASTEDFRLEMEEMGRSMNELSDEIGQEASENIERHSEALRQSIDELADSARQALKEHGAQLSEEDRQTLDDVVGELEEESDRLSEPNATSMAESSKNAVQAQERLFTINEKVLEQYRQQWLAWQRQFEAEARRFLDELDALLDSREENRSRPY